MTTIAVGAPGSRLELPSRDVLAVLGVLAPDATALQESVAVAATSVPGGLGRYLVLRNWVFGEPATA